MDIETKRREREEKAQFRARDNNDQQSIKISKLNNGSLILYTGILIASCVILAIYWYTEQSVRLKAWLISYNACLLIKIMNCRKFGPFILKMGDSISLINLFLFVWTIIGHVWVKGINQPSNIAFEIFIITWIMFAYWIFMAAIICCCCCAVCVGGSNAVTFTVNGHTVSDRNEIASILLGVNYARHRALSPEDVQKISTREFTANDKDSQCCICNDDYTIGETIKILPCNHHHIFHPTCIDSWLQVNASCPLCRAIIPRSSTNSVVNISTTQQQQSFIV